MTAWFMVCRLAADPPVVKIDTAFRGNVRPFKMVPIGHSVFAQVPVRNHVVAMQEYMIQRANPMNQFVSVRCLNHPINQLIDYRVVHANGVARALYINVYGMPVIALFVTR